MYSINKLLIPINSFELCSKYNNMRSMLLGFAQKNVTFSMNPSLYAEKIMHRRFLRCPVHHEHPFLFGSANVAATGRANGREVL